LKFHPLARLPKLVGTLEAPSFKLPVPYKQPEVDPRNQWMTDEDTIQLKALKEAAE
jgi:hypothetical protein